MIIQVYREDDPLVLKGVEHLPRVGEIIMLCDMDVGGVPHTVTGIFHAFDAVNQQAKISLMVDPPLK